MSSALGLNPNGTGGIKHWFARRGALRSRPGDYEGNPRLVSLSTIEEDSCPRSYFCDDSRGDPCRRREYCEKVIFT